MRTGGGRVGVNQGTLLGAFSCQVSFPSLLPAVAASFLTLLYPVGGTLGTLKPLITNSRTAERRVTTAYESSAEGSGDPGDGCFVVFFLFG